MNDIDTAEFEKKILYEFKNKYLLDEALRHSSFVHEQLNENLMDNERLEFLGDAVLSLAIGHILMQRYPDLNEGNLSRMRANLVNESRLASIARSINLGTYIQLGKGEIQSGGNEKNSILADSFEAVLAAVYLDGGFEAVFKIIESHFSSFFDSISASSADHDYKSQLQELVQELHKTVPQYKVIQEKGPDHDKTFDVQLTVCEIKAQGIGKSKKAAEQDAAKKALELLRNEKSVPAMREL